MAFPKKTHQPQHNFWHQNLCPPSKLRLEFLSPSPSLGGSGSTVLSTVSRFLENGKRGWFGRVFPDLYNPFIIWPMLGEEFGAPSISTNSSWQNGSTKGVYMVYIYICVCSLYILQILQIYVYTYMHYHWNVYMIYIIFLVNLRSFSIQIA